MFGSGAVCFEPLTPAGWQPAMTLPSLVIALNAFFNAEIPARVVKVTKDEKIPEYNRAAAETDVKRIISAHGGGKLWSQKIQNMKS